MTQLKMLAALLATAIIISLAGCVANSNTAEGTSETRKPAATVGIASDTDTHDDAADAVPATDATRSSATEESTAEKESDALQDSVFSETEKPISSPPAITPTESTNPTSQEKPVPSEPPKIEESKPVSPPTTATEEPVAPPTTPVEEPEPSQPEPTEPPAPSFDIGYWISYAQNYATSIGLRLESSAVDCWDNPIIAGAHCIYLERDIQSRLNRYNRDQDITDVWIWAELRADGSYDLYIGYA